MKGDISELYRKVGDGVLSFSPSSCPIKVFQSVISLSRTYVSLDIIDATLDRVGWWRYYSVKWEIAWLSLLMEEICLNSKLQT